MLTLLMSVFLLCPLAYAAEHEALLGLWNTPQDKAKVEIFRCGDKFCGRIKELQEPNFPDDDAKGMAGQPKVDRNNPDPLLRTRPLLGLQIMEGFGHCGQNQWEGGTIYDPKNGKTYKCKMTLADQDLLKVRGFIGISLLGRTQIWTR